MNLNDDRQFFERVIILSDSIHASDNDSGQQPGTLLFSVDLEDVRLMVPNGQDYREAVPAMTSQYLEFLDRHDSKATFFIVGKVALQYPGLIQEIKNRGHEIACHSHNHIPLDKMGADGFRRDLEENLEALVRAGASQPLGYRAPTFSMTADTQWAYPILGECGIIYSSSVLPAANPLYGWPGFGAASREISGIIELPVTLSGSPFLNVPFAGGIYLRVIPFTVTQRWFKQCLKKNVPVVTYLHPYDIDANQERFMHPGLNGNRIYNRLMYVNRRTVLEKIDRVLELGYEILPSAEYVSSLDAARVTP